jgi:hypothetical protein
LGDFGPDWETELKFVFKERRMDVNWINPLALEFFFKF